MKKLFLLLFSFLFACSSPTLTRVTNAPTKPNIVLIVADDMGWADVEYKSDYYKTPNITRLAALGKTFTNAYSCGPNCMPTRGSIWPGKYAPRTEIYTVGDSNRGLSEFRKLDGVTNKWSLDPSQVTIAERLNQIGYICGYFGKWHLGNDPELGPVSQGFSVNYGGTSGGGVGATHFANSTGEFPWFPNLGPNGKPFQFMADRLTDESIDWMQDRTEPFFMAMMHYSPHTPIQAPAEDIAHFDNIEKGNKHKDQTYAAMLWNLDKNVGRLIDFLENTFDPRWSGHKLIENTVIIFTSDNGGVGGYADAGITGTAEYTNQFPLKGGKGMLYEGGIRVPFILCWDGVVNPSSEDTPIMSADLFPTFEEIAGGAPTDGLDGGSLLPLLAGGSLERDLFWHFPCYLEANVNAGTWRTTPVSAIRRGKWKLLFFYENKKIELYNLETDIGETTNVAGSNFSLVSSMITSLRNWLISTNAKMPLVKGTQQEVPYPAAFTVKETPAIVK